MTIDEIRRQYDRVGKLPVGAVDTLRELLRSSDPYAAITMVGDFKLADLAGCVGQCLTSDDPMIRWNAICVLTTRLRIAEYAEPILAQARSEEDEVVRGAALVGVGALMPLLDGELKRRIGETLVSVLTDSADLPEMRSAAYEGILSALDVPIRNRPSAAEVLNFDHDVSDEVLAQFRAFMR